MKKMSHGWKRNMIDTVKLLGGAAIVIAGVLSATYALFYALPKASCDAQWGARAEFSVVGGCVVWTNGQPTPARNIRGLE